MTIEFNNKYEFHTMEYNLDYLQMFKDRGVEIIYRNKKYLFTFDEDSTPRVDGILLSNILQSNPSRSIPTYAFKAIYSGFIMGVHNSMMDCFEYYGRFSGFSPIRQKECFPNEIRPMTFLFTYFCEFLGVDANIINDENFQQEYLEIVGKFLKGIGFDFNKVDMIPCAMKKGEDLSALVSIAGAPASKDTLVNDIYVPIMIVGKQDNPNIRIKGFNASYHNVHPYVGCDNFYGLEK